jgi:hypothetical protein
MLGLVGGLHTFLAFPPPAFCFLEQTLVVEFRFTRLNISCVFFTVTTPWTCPFARLDHVYLA